MKGKRSIGEEFDHESGLSGLLNGIILQAAKDYLRSKKWLRNHPDKDQDVRTMYQRRYEAMRDLKSAEEFFHSDWYRWMCDIDADELIKILDSEVECESENISE